MDEYGKPIFLGLAFLCHKNLEPKLDDGGDYDFTRLNDKTKLKDEEDTETIIYDGLDDNQKKALKDETICCWIIEHATSKDNKRKNDITAWVGDVMFTLFDTKSKTKRQKIVIHIESQIFKINDLKKTVLKLRTKLTDNLLSKFDINTIEHTDESVDEFTKILKNINTVLFLLNSGHQKILAPVYVPTSKKSITKMTPFTHRQLLKYPNRQIIPIQESQEKINPAYYGIISDLKDLLEYFNKQFIENNTVKMSYLKEPKNNVAEIKGIENDVVEIEVLEKKIIEKIKKIEKSNFFRLVLDNKPISDRAPDVSFFQHDLNMQLYHYIKEFEKVIGFTDSKSIKNQLYYIKSKIDSVPITPIADLYEKWVGTQLLDILREDFHFTHEKNSPEDLQLNFLFPPPLPLPPESLTKKQKKEEEQKAKKKAQDENKIELYNEKLGCKVELMYEPELRKIEAGDAKPDFYLKFTKNKISKILIIDAKYSKYDNSKDILKTGKSFGTSISDIAKKYYRAYDTSQDTSFQNIVFVAHPDTDVREPLNCNKKPIGEVLYDVHLDLLKDLDKTYKADRDKLDEKYKANRDKLDEKYKADRDKLDEKYKVDRDKLDEKYKVDRDFIQNYYELKKSHHFGSICLHHDDDQDFENNKQLNTLIRMVLQHHLGIKNWCFKCNKPAEKEGIRYKCDNCKTFWIHYRCKESLPGTSHITKYTEDYIPEFCNTDYYSWLYSYVAHDSNDEIKCPQCRLGDLKKPKESSN